MELTVKIKFVRRPVHCGTSLRTAMVLETGYDMRGYLFSEEADMTKAKELASLIKEAIDKYEKHLKEEYKKEGPRIIWEKSDRKMSL